MNLRNIYLIFFSIIIAFNLSSCKNDSEAKKSSAQEDTFIALEKLADEDPSRENIGNLIDAVMENYRVEKHGSESGKQLLLRGVGYCEKYNRMGPATFFYTPLLKEYPVTESTKDYIFDLAKSMNSIQKISASDVLFSNFNRMYPDDSRIAESKALISKEFIDMDSYLKNQSEKAFKSGDDRKQFLKSVHEYVDACEAFAISDPTNIKTPTYLYKGSELARSVKSLNKVISLYDWILEKYPEFEKIATVHFLKGFILENEAGKPELAKKVYEDFLLKYPNHELADDVKFLIENIGKSNDEILKMLGRDKK